MFRLMRQRVVLVWFIACVAGCEGPMLVIVPTSLPDGIEGSSYQQTLMTDAGGGESWQIISGRLPGGLVLNSSTGVISGVPSESGVFAFSVYSTQGGLTVREGERSFGITIIPRLVVSASLDAARQGEPYNEQIDVTGGTPPYTYQLIGLPGGIVFDATDGSLSGTPTQPDSGRTLRAVVTDSGTPPQVESRDIFFEVKPPSVRITTTALTDGSLGAFYSREVMAEGGFTPYSFRITAGVLPAGLSLPNNRRTGVISGIPTEQGTFNFTIEVTDDDTPASVDTADLTIEIH